MISNETDINIPDDAEIDIAAGEAVQAAEDADLLEGVLSLSRLATGRLSLEESLTRVAQFAVRAIPGAEGAGLTMLEDGRPETIVTTEPFVAEVDAIQYHIGQGPCITAAREGSTVRSGSLGGDKRWPQFGSRVARLGVHSALCLPLLTSDGVLGAMNIYARTKHVFDEHAARTGELFAVPAAIAVQNAQVLDHTKRLAGQLQAALDSRSIIERAIGIIIGRAGCTEDEALAQLRSLSQHQHQKLRAVAQVVLAEATRRPPSRR